MCMRESQCSKNMHTHIHKYINSLQAIKDIAAGQEILVRYGSAKWFEKKNIPYSDVDYASTMWRPDLHPIPCRENLRLTTGADGRHSFAVVNNFPAGTYMDISPCVKVSIIVVDQFLLWDFVLIYTESETVYMYEDAQVCWPPSTHTNKCVHVKSHRYASLCPTPRKSLPHPIPTSLTCACHSWACTKMCVSVG